ncbi:MAG: 30S ribosomal protein S6 [Candidatus Margulisbacteria bacterium]|nr:30S ribosomal protein S6 [Candidatus Margulisiibacteriota bacterium]
MKKAYDILVIIKAHLGDEKIEKLTTNFKKWITDNEGEIQLFEDQGVTDMPITFQPALQGHYLHCEFEGTNKTLDQLKEKMRVDESFLRHLIVNMDSIRDTRPAVVEEKVAQD